MSQNNLLQSYNWEAQYEDGQVQFTRPIQEEVISVYEVYVKEETVGGETRTDVEAGSNDAIRLPERIDRMTNSRFPAGLTTLGTGPTGLVFEADCMDLEAAIDSEVISFDGTGSKLLPKDSIKYKILDEASNVSEENSVVVYSHPAPLPTAVQTPGLVAGIGGSNENGSNVVSTVTLSNLAPSVASSSLASLSSSLQLTAPTTLPSTSTSATATRLIDKDDPRSRLHFVKYLKREGKTLKIWECGICSKEFRHQYTLMRHLPTHTDERNFKCDACGKAFRQLSTLSQHKAIHSDARPYVCEFCKKTFNRVSTLISHRKTHSEHKPHKCHLCGKGFHQKGNLRNHVFTHTNERPYKCELCGKGFNQMSNLVCHKVKAHAHAEKMQYACGICGKEFPRRFSLRSHEEYKHGIKYRQPGGLQSVQSVAAANINQGSNLKILHASSGSGGEGEGSAADSNAKGLGLDKRSINRTRDGSNDLSMFEYSGGEEEVQGMLENTVIGRIATKAMESALLQGQTPFALFKPLKGIPVLVKVSPSGTDKHVLTAATAEDLRLAGKITLDSSLNLSDLDGLKAVQIKVPVVATITQSIDANGKLSFFVEAPTSGLDLEKDGYVECGAGALITEPMEAHLTYSEATRVGDVRTQVAALEQIELDRVRGKGVAGSKRRFRMKSRDKDNKDVQKERSAITSGGPEEVSSVLSVLPGGPEETEEPEEPGDCDNELLELAAQGGIQFVRATEDGRYEVMSNSEARDLMAQNSHDMTILDGKDAESIGFLDIRTTPEVATAVSGCEVTDQVIIGDVGQQIMLLDSGSPPRTSPLQVDEIEILENKDIRVLESRSTSIEERLTDGIAFLSHSKIGELMLEPRDLSLDVDGVSVVEADKEGQWSEYNILCSVLLNDVVCSVERGPGGTCGAGAHHLRYHQHHHHLYQQQNEQPHHHHHHHHQHHHQQQQQQQQHHHHPCQECTFATESIFGDHPVQSSVSRPSDSVGRDVSIVKGDGNEELLPEYRVSDEKEYVQMEQQSLDEFDVRKKLSELASVLNLQSVQEESITVPRNRSQIKILGGRDHQVSRILPNSTERPAPKLSSAGGSNQIKILGAKKHQSSPSRRNVQRNEASSDHVDDDLGLTVDSVVTTVERKNVKILGRRLKRVGLPENQTLEAEKGPSGRLGGDSRNEDPSKKRHKAKENPERSNDLTEGTIMRSMREGIEEVQDVDAGRIEESLVGQATRADSLATDFLLSACSPCPADFLNFEAQDSESSAEAVDRFERHCQREREYVMAGLPDLD